MSSMTRITRVLVGTAAVAAALLLTATPASAVTRDYLDLPVAQLADVTHFDITDTSVSVDVLIPADVPAGHVWTFIHTEFAAGGFDHQYDGPPKVHEPLTPGQPYTLNLPISTGPCEQVDLVLVGPLNPTGQPYAADLTDSEVCRPGYVVTSTIPATPTTQLAAPPTTVAEQPTAAAIGTQAVTPIVLAEQSAPVVPAMQTSSVAATPASLPVTGGSTGLGTTAGLTTIALGIAFMALARAKRADLI